MKKVVLKVVVVLTFGLAIIGCEKENVQKETRTNEVKSTTDKNPSQSNKNSVSENASDKIRENEIRQIISELPPLHVADINVNQYNVLSYSIRTMTHDEIMLYAKGGQMGSGNGDDDIRPMRVCKDQGQSVGFAKCIAAAVKKYGCIKLTAVGNEIQGHTC